MNPLWKVYKSKVLKTLNPDQEEDTAEEVIEVENDVSPVLEDEGPSAVSQLAKRVQGAGTKGWNRMSALFNKDDEHQLLEETESQPVADHPLAMRPEEPRPAKRSPFWDNFATKWQQAAAMKQQEAAAAATAGEAGTEDGQEAAGEGGREERQEGEYAEREESEGGGGGGGGGGGSSNNSFSKYASLGGGSEDTAFKWNFVTSKLAELKTKSMAKTN